MSEQEQPLTPAMAEAIKMPPALVQAIQEDPELLVELTRGQLALVQDRMIRKALADPEISLAQLAVVHERLSKNARLEPKEGAPGAGAGAPKVVINIIRGSGRPGVTIEGTAAVVAEPDVASAA